jgi:Tfp pilus assembly protein PilX
MAALLITLVVSPLLVGISLTVAGDQRLRAVDRDRTLAFDAAQAGLEQLASSLGNLFATSFRPRCAQIESLTTTLLSCPASGSTAVTNESGYAIGDPQDAQGNPVATSGRSCPGRTRDLLGLIPYTNATTAQTISGGEVRVGRSLQTVAIPPFQFGIFSENDASTSPATTLTSGGGSTRTGTCTWPRWSAIRSRSPTA